VLVPLPKLNLGGINTTLIPIGLLNKQYAAIISAYAKLQNVSTKLNNSVGHTVDLLNQIQDQSRKTKDQLAILRTRLSLLERRTENLSSELKQLDTSVTQFLDGMIKLTNDLNKTIIVLDEYTKKNPSTILKPVTAKIESAFQGSSQIVYNLPGLMAIILLFVTLLVASSLIVTERKSGTMARLFLSPISMFFFVLEKMLFLCLLCAVQIVSMLFAAWVFGVGVSLSLNFVIIMLVAALMYVSIGVFIGAVSKSENTALLTSLVISFPLMFMSGVFSAPELMSKFLREASAYLPLTLHIGALEKILIYRTLLDVNGLIWMGGIALFFYLVSVFLIRRTPMIKS